MKDQIKTALLELEPELIQIRRKLHEFPELSFQEKKTSLLIHEILDQWGIAHETGIAGYGIVGTIQGNLESNYKIVLRADMDALPISENSNFEFKSKNEGIMHACGHDVHMTCLLGCLRILHQFKEHWGGLVKFIFQPAEELLPGGASLMIKEGVLGDGIYTCVIGLHVQPNLAVGKVGICPGSSMASSDEIHIEFNGPGGHAAMPHLSKDLIFIGSNFVNYIYGIFSRVKPPTTSAVMSFGKMETNGGATNVIPVRLKLEGTFRSLDSSFRKIWIEMLYAQIESFAAIHGIEIKAKILKGYPVLYNNPKISNEWVNIAQEVLGKDNVVSIDPRMTAEDFAYYAEIVPGCFFRLGIGKSSNVHTPDFQVDESSILVGSEIFVHASLNFLKNV